MQGLLRTLSEIQGHLFKIDLVGLDLGEIEDVIDEVKEGLPPLVNRLETFSGIRPGRVSLEEICHADDGIERSTDLMTHGGEKSTLGAIGTLRTEFFMFQQGVGFAKLFDTSVLLGDVLECSVKPDDFAFRKLGFPQGANPERASLGRDEGSFQIP